MLYTTRGIVLHYNRYGDDSAIVDIFTLSHGSLSFMVRDRRGQRGGGLRASLLRPLSVVELSFDYQPQRSLHRLREVHIAHSYSTLPYDPLKEAVALLLSEFLHNALRSEVKDEELYHYILYSLQWFDSAERGLANFHLAFLIGLTHYLGIAPNVDVRTQQTASQQNTTSQPDAFFDLKDGILCDAAPQHGYFVYGEEAAALPLLLRMNLRNMHRFRLNRHQRLRILDVLTVYYRLHVPEFRELRSIEVLRTLLD